MGMREECAELQDPSPLLMRRRMSGGRAGQSPRRKSSKDDRCFIKLNSSESFSEKISGNKLLWECQVTYLSPRECRYSAISEILALPNEMTDVANLSSNRQHFQENLHYFPQKNLHLFPSIVVAISLLPLFVDQM